MWSYTPQLGVFRYNICSLGVKINILGNQQHGYALILTSRALANYQHIEEETIEESTCSVIVLDKAKTEQDDFGLPVLHIVMC